MRQFLRDNGLSVALFILFLISILGQAIAGWRTLAEELRLHEQPPVGFVACHRNPRSLTRPIPKTRHRINGVPSRMRPGRSTGAACFCDFTRIRSASPSLRS
jgi:hypothetical protein